MVALFEAPGELTEALAAPLVAEARRAMDGRSVWPCLFTGEPDVATYQPARAEKSTFVSLILSPTLSLSLLSLSLFWRARDEQTAAPISPRLPRAATRGAKSLTP